MTTIEQGEYMGYAFDWVVVPDEENEPMIQIIVYNKGQEGPTIKYCYEPEAAYHTTKEIIEEKLND